MINTVYEGKWIESNSLDKLKNILRNFPACKIDNVHITFGKNLKVKFHIKLMIWIMLK